MTQHSTPAVRGLILGALAALGVATILGSSTFDEETAVERIRATVDITITGASEPLDIEDGRFRISLTNLALSGAYEQNQGDQLTLVENVITLDTLTVIDASVAVADSEETLSGGLSLTVNEAIDYGLDHTPVAGRFSVDFEGSTSVVAVQADPAGVNISVGDGDPVFSAWSSFEGYRDDTNADADLRIASIAYRLPRDVLRAARLSEEALLDVEQEADMLESVGLGSDLTLSCSNASSGEHLLFWTADIAGSGSGTAGDNDSFEARYANCLSAAENLYRGGIIELNSVAFETDVQRFLGAGVILSNLFYSTEEITLGTTTHADGPFTLRIDETPLP